MFEIPEHGLENVQLLHAFGTESKYYIVRYVLLLTRHDRLG